MRRLETLISNVMEEEHDQQSYDEPYLKGQFDLWYTTGGKATQIKVDVPKVRYQHDKV